jgi:hypothetical protein
MLLAGKTLNQSLAKMRLPTAAEVGQSAVRRMPIYLASAASSSTMKIPIAPTLSTWSLKTTATPDANPSKGKLSRRSHL